MFIYKLKRDALLIVARMNNGCGTPDLATFKRQVVFVQSQLMMAAIRDPAIPQPVKLALVSFQDATIKEMIDDRRGLKRRGNIELFASLALQ